MAHACTIANDELGCGIEPQREICEKAVCGKTPVDPFLLLESCEKRQEEKEEQSKKSEEEIKKQKELENTIVEVIKVED